MRYVGLACLLALVGCRYQPTNAPIVGDPVAIAELDPYISPECQCPVTTVFTGSLVGDTLRGTFVTNSRSMEMQRGPWQMIRSARSR